MLEELLVARRVDDVLHAAAVGLHLLLRPHAPLPRVVQHVQPCVLSLPQHQRADNVEESVVGVDLIGQARVEADEVRRGVRQRRVVVDQDVACNGRLAGREHPLKM